MRTTLVTITVLAVALAGCTAAPPAPDPPPAVGLAGLGIRAAKPDFGPGEPVVLTVTVTNTGGTPCRLTRVADGALTVLALLRDGVPVVPVPGTATYLGGFARYLAGELTEVRGGGNVEFGLSSADGGGFRSYSADAAGGADVDHWPVTEPGRYALTIGYLRPTLPGVPTDPCQGAARTASTAFTVRGAA